MLGLQIKELKIVVDTHDGRFSSKLELKDGLNIIRAENSSGKSTIINSIAYGLGLEAVLGPSRNKPFPKSLYEVLDNNKTEEKKFYVKSSSVTLKIQNSNDVTATLIRDVLGDADKVNIRTNGEYFDCFLGSSGQVGSAKSALGFHHWLESFIGWSLPNVTTFNGRQTKLYLECIFPLFFIEQKRGWSEIQANIPKHYGIKNIKKSAIEFCLDIDNFNYEAKLAALNNRIKDNEKEWDTIQSFSESVADFNEVRVNQIGNLDKDTLPKIEFSYLENEVFVSLDNHRSTLIKYIDKLEKNHRKPYESEQLDSKLALMRSLKRRRDNVEENIEIKRLSILDVESKLTTLEHDHDQYLQLRRLKAVGSDISDKLETNKCPICESDLYDTLGKKTIKRRPMTLDENIDFLKNQIDFYQAIRKKNIDEMKSLEADAHLISSKILSAQDEINLLRNELDDINGEIKTQIRKKVEAESALRELNKLKNTQDEINNKINNIRALWILNKKSLKQLKESNNKTNSYQAINELQALIKTNLSDFGLKQSAISTITISNQTLRPEQAGYDIVAETSASDYIRIIWSYTLSLLELASKTDSIKHGGFIVFDEPRQHEASALSFTNLIKNATKAKEYGGQVIFATSIKEDELKEFCEGEDIHLISYGYDDYVLSLEKVDT